MKRYTRTIYCSEWIKQKTIEFYGTDPDTIDVVDFGANIPNPTNFNVATALDVCNLLFIGTVWKKKGGQKVLDAYHKLKNEGFPCTLTIIGSTPDTPQEPDENLTIIPFLYKSRPEDLERLCSILAKSHFFVLPTEYDAYGIVFCEASAYAVPSIASNVCGVSQPIKEGVNGYLMPPTATAEDYAEKIKTVFDNKEDYLNLRASSRNEFETRLNWDAWAKQVTRILEKTVAQYNKNREINLFINN